LLEEAEDIHQILEVAEHGLQEAEAALEVFCIPHHQHFQSEILLLRLVEVELAEQQFLFQEQIHNVVHYQQLEVEHQVVAQEVQMEDLAAAELEL
jgi:hypothetical protein